jgi:hypothetical protein
MCISAKSCNSAHEGLLCVARDYLTLSYVSIERGNVWVRTSNRKEEEMERRSRRRRRRIGGRV